MTPVLRMHGLFLTLNPSWVAHRALPYLHCTLHDIIVGSESTEQGTTRRLPDVL